MSSDTANSPLILVPRPAGDPLAQELEEAGFRVWAHPLTRSVPLVPHSFTQTLARLSSGHYAWMVITSKRTLTGLAALMAHIDSPTDPNCTYPVTSSVENIDLTSYLPSGEDMLQLAAVLLEADQSGTRFATVGQSSAHQLRKLGVPVEITADKSGSALINKWPKTVPFVPSATTSPHMLLPGSAQSSPILSQGLADVGWKVEQMPIYSTQTVPQIDPNIRQAYRAGDFSAVIVTAGSNARALNELLGPPPPNTAVVTLGQPSAQTAESIGLPVHATAEYPTATSLTQAIRAALP